MSHLEYQIKTNKLNIAESDAEHSGVRKKSRTCPSREFETKGDSK